LNWTVGFWGKNQHGSFYVEEWFQIGSFFGPLRVLFIRKKVWPFLKNIKYMDFFSLKNWYFHVEHELDKSGKFAFSIGTLNVKISLFCVVVNDGSRSKNFDPGPVGSIFCGLGQKISLVQKVPRSKEGRPLIYCGSKVSSSQVRAHL